MWLSREFCIKHAIPVLRRNSGPIICKEYAEAMFEFRKANFDFPPLSVAVMTSKPIDAVVQQVRHNLPQVGSRHVNNERFGRPLLQNSNILLCQQAGVQFKVALNFFLNAER